MADIHESIHQPLAMNIDPIDEDRLRKAAELLLAARRDKKPISDLPSDLRPTTLAEAYHLQDIVATALGPIGGWKVGAPTPNAVPICSPIPLRGGFAPTGATIRSRYSRLRGIEAEIAFQLGKDLPLRSAPYLEEEVVTAIAGAHPAIEILESAFEDPDHIDPLSVTADLAMNGGFAYGTALPSWRDVDLTQESATVIIDGVVRVENSATNPAGADLLRLVTWLANEGQFRTGGLKAGDWLTTGSWTGKGLAIEDSEVIVQFALFGEARIKFERD
jgi:2-keto-4-pentenoate hydratase